MKKQQSIIGFLAAIVFVLLATLFLSVGIIMIINGEATSIEDLNVTHAILGIAISFLGMAKVSFSRHKDGIDMLIAMVVNGLFGLGTLFAIIGSGVAFHLYPEKYDWAAVAVMGGISAFIALLAPLLHNRMSSPIIIDEQKRWRLSTAAILSLILFGNLLSIIVFHVWILFFR